MSGRHAPLGAAVALVAALGACTSSSLPPTASAPPANTVVVTTPQGTTTQTGNVIVVPSARATVTLVPARLSGSEIDAVVKYVYARMVGHGPSTYEDCVDFWGKDTRQCDPLKK